MVQSAKALSHEGIFWLGVTNARIKAPLSKLSLACILPNRFATGISARRTG
jgi:hypothetical protein